MPLKGEFSDKLIATVRYQPGDLQTPEAWTGMTVGDLLTEKSYGGTAHVYALGEVEQHTPRMAAKIFNAETIKLVQYKKEHADRILFLAINEPRLKKDLDFCIWPRRLLFLQKPKQTGAIHKKLIGFGMDRLENTVSLGDLIDKEAERANFQERDYVAVAVHLADCLQKLHAHDFKFVFGDFNARNIHITKTRDRKIKFIDTDSFQLDPPGVPEPFNCPPFVAFDYTSPDARKQLIASEMLKRSHDEFVLAIHICILLMGSLGRPYNPFDASDNNDIASLIDKRAFVFDNQAQYPVRPSVIETYLKLPQNIREAFTTSFTKTPLTAAQWGTLLATYWRLLQRPGAVA